MRRLLTGIANWGFRPAPAIEPGPDHGGRQLAVHSDLGYYPERGIQSTQPGAAGFNDVLRPPTRGRPNSRVTGGHLEQGTVPLPSPCSGAGEAGPSMQGDSEHGVGLR